MGTYGRVRPGLIVPHVNAPSRANAFVRQALRSLPVSVLPNFPAARNNVCSSPVP